MVRIFFNSGTKPRMNTQSLYVVTDSESHETFRVGLLSDLHSILWDFLLCNSRWDSDVCDVLAYIAYASETHTRAERALQAGPAIWEARTDIKQ